MPGIQKNVAYTLDIGLFLSGSLVMSPTLATGDFKISKDNGATANLATLPVVAPSSSGVVKVVLAQAEMNADRVTIIGRDAAGGNWEDVLVALTTTGDTVDTVKTVVDAILVDTGTTLQAELDAIQAAVITNATGADISADIIALKAETVLIVADTNELQVDNVPGLISTLDTVVDTVKADTAAILVDTGTTIPATITTIDNEIATIDTVVDGIQTDLSNGTDGLGAIKTSVDAIPTTAMRGTDSANTTTPPTVGAIADAVWDEAQGDHTGGATFGALAAEIAVIDGIVDTILVDTAELQSDDIPGTLSTLTGKVDTVDGIVDAILVDTNELQSDDVPGLISTLDAVVDTVKVDTAAILADTNELQGDDVPGLIAALNDVSTAEVNAQVDTALTDIHLDHLFHANYDPASKPGSATALLNEIVENDGGVSRFTTNALENGPSGSGASAAAIADAVWDETQSTHTTGGSFGEIATEVAAVLVDTGTTIPGTLTTIDNEIATIDTVVDGIQTDLSNATDGLGAIKTDTAAILTDTGTTIPASLTTIDNEVGAIDTVVDAILVDTGTTLQAELDAIQAAVITNATGVDIAADIIALKAETVLIVADTNELQTDDIPGDIAALNDPTAAAIADAVWDETQSTHVDAGSFGAIATEIAVVKGKTDSLTFTVANKVDANVKSINDVTIVGDGDATPFDV